MPTLVTAMGTEHASLAGEGVTKGAQADRKQLYQMGGAQPAGASCTALPPCCEGRDLPQPDAQSEVSTSTPRGVVRTRVSEQLLSEIYRQ